MPGMIVDHGLRQIEVACATCGHMMPMPFDGPLPEYDTPEWWRLQEMAMKYSREVLAAECQYAETRFHEGWPW